MRTAWLILLVGIVLLQVDVVDASPASPAMAKIKSTLPRRQIAVDSIASSSRPRNGKTDADCALRASTPPSSEVKLSLRSKKLELISIFVAWLYFLCTSMNVSTLPGYINSVLNAHGEEKVSQLGVKVYGNLQGFDAFFTFLSVNLVGCLSDVFGRKPFMFLSSLGLGTAYFMHSIAHRPSQFYLASCVDGLTSCMMSQSQSFITDLTAEETNLGIALSRFQGIAIGMAFLIGIPMGQVLSKKFGRVTPLRASVAICALNCALMLWLLPAKVQRRAAPPATANTAAAAKANKHADAAAVQSNEVQPQDRASLLERLRTVTWHQANPLGAAWILTKSRPLLLASLAYFCINLAQCGVQATWINYLGYKFNMSAQQAGSTLLLVGIMMAVIPPFAMYAPASHSALPLTDRSLCCVLSVFVATAPRSASPGRSACRWRCTRCPSSASVSAPPATTRCPSTAALTTTRALCLLCLLCAVACASSPIHVFVGMPFLAAGASALPMILGYMTQQVRGQRRLLRDGRSNASSSSRPRRSSGRCRRGRCAAGRSRHGAHSVLDGRLAAVRRGLQPLHVRGGAATALDAALHLRRLHLCSRSVRWFDLHHCRSRRTLRPFDGRQQRGGRRRPQLGGRHRFIASRPSPPFPRCTAPLDHIKERLLSDYNCSIRNTHYVQR